MNIMIIAAHPDDAELSIGGTIITHSLNGDNVYLLNLTNGEPTPYGSVDTRLQEAQIADEIMHIKKRIILDFPNRYLPDTIECRTKTAEYIRKYKPDLLLIQYHLDAHPDHISTSSIGTASRFYAKYTKSNMEGDPHYPPKMIYFIASHMKFSMNPSFVLPLSNKIFSEKLKLIEAYKSQFSHGKNKVVPQYIETIGKYYGSLIGHPYGEPFYTPEVLGIQSFHNLV